MTIKPTITTSQATAGSTTATSRTTQITYLETTVNEVIALVGGGEIKVKE